MALQPAVWQYYDLEQSDDKRPLQAFHQFIQESLIRTDNPVTSKQEQFLPFEQIEYYFSEEDRLIDILSAVFPDEEPIPVEDSVVQYSYLKTFCIYCRLEEQDTFGILLNTMAYPMHDCPIPRSRTISQYHHPNQSYGTYFMRSNGCSVQQRCTTR
jgi:hypothetical protein